MHSCILDLEGEKINGLSQLSGYDMLHPAQYNPSLRFCSDLRPCGVCVQQSLKTLIRDKGWHQIDFSLTPGMSHMECWKAGSILSFNRRSTA